jgi:hypothetical protein
MLGQAQTDDNEFAAAIKTEYLFAWKNYILYAGNNDALRPVSRKGYEIYFESFLVGRVENLSTQKIMGLDKEYAENKAYLKAHFTLDRKVFVPTTEFGQRIISAFLSAYQSDPDPYYLQVATNLANKLLPAFSTKTGMPWRMVSLSSRSVQDQIATPTQVASLSVEFSLLSKLTRNPLYNKKAVQAAEALFALRDSFGLLGTRIDVQSGLWIDKSATMADGTAGFYRNTLKAWLLGGENTYKRIWQEGTTDAKRELLKQNTHGVYFAHLNGPKHVADSLYFANEIPLAGLFALGGQTKFSSALWKYYQSLADTLVLFPQVWDVKRMRPKYLGYDLKGADVENILLQMQYIPNFNGLELSKKIFAEIQKRCKQSYGYTNLSDLYRGIPTDEMPPEFMAKTLKMLYLIAKPSALDLKKVVFSGNGQPLRWQ